MLTGLKVHVDLPGAAGELVVLAVANHAQDHGQHLIPGSDEWGRPGYSWYKNGSRTSLTNANTGKAYMIKDGHPLYSGSTTGNLRWRRS